MSILRDVSLKSIASDRIAHLMPSLICSVAVLDKKKPYMNLSFETAP
jgi:hypothetical protein